MRNVSGLTINAGEGRPTDVVTLRGFRTASDTFIDGVRDDGNYIRDLSNVERIDVLKGPSSVLYGRGSTGGIINIISKKPVAEQFLTTTLTGGFYDLYRGEIDTGGPLDNEALSYRFSAAYQDSESFRDFFYLERFNAAPSLAWKASEDTRFLVQFEHQDDESLLDFGIPAISDTSSIENTRGGPADVPIETFYGFPEDNFLKNDVNTATFSVNHKLSSQWTVRNVLKYADYRQETNNTRLTSVDVTTGVPL